MSVAPVYTVRALDESTWPAFAALVERNNGVFGGCWCMGFHDDTADTEIPKPRTEARSRASRHGARGSRVRRGRLPGLVPVRRTRRGAEDQEPRGIREGPRRRCRTGGSRAISSARGTGARVWPVRRSRARSISLPVSAVGEWRGIPEAAGSVPAGFLFNGALSTYEKLGFVRDRKIGKHRWVVTRVVEPTS